ncbi:MAG: hypothetical protein QOF25_766, partial [Mycobacterium sp.]|nr:hypothetical protein [Mycobacterium sp.]
MQIAGGMVVEIGEVGSRSWVKLTTQRSPLASEEMA